MEKKNQNTMIILCLKITKLKNIGHIHIGKFMEQ